VSGGQSVIKKDIRKGIIETLQKITDTDKKAIEQKLYEHLFQSDVWKNAETVGITISRGFEWNTRPIIEEGWKLGKTIAVPKCYPDEKKLVFYQLHSFDELETVYYNLLEPIPYEQNKLVKNKINLIIVPGVVFNQNGYRIGFGGGYYDRFLSDYEGNTISLLHEKQLVDDIPVENHDIPVNRLITESGFLK
jgi:5-formyltetrahydrofolate cyclo-ligase